MKYFQFNLLIDKNSEIKTINSCFVKDNISFQNFKFTLGYKNLKEHQGIYNSFFLNILLQISNFEIVGKTSLDEFAIGSFSTNTFQIPINPIFKNIPIGGSSGGSAGLTYFFSDKNLFIGSSTGGSISLPASFCLTPSYTPSFGFFTRFGLGEYSNILDKIGFLKNLIFIKKNFKKFCEIQDITIFKKNFLTTYKIEKILFFKNYFKKIFSKDFLEIKKIIFKILNKLDLKIEEINFPESYLKKSFELYSIISSIESYSNLQRYYGLISDFKLFNNYNEKIAYNSQQFHENTKKKINLGKSFIKKFQDDKILLKIITFLENFNKKQQNLFSKNSLLLFPTTNLKNPEEFVLKKYFLNYNLEKFLIYCNIRKLPHITIPIQFKQNKFSLLFLSNSSNDEKLLDFFFNFSQCLKLD